MADSNITKVYLFNVPFTNDNHTLYFNSKDEQRNYFNSLSSKVFTDFSYQRKESVMRIPLQFDECIKYNYVAYMNTAYSEKWFYAFITDYEFKGDDQTNIKIETDVLQTWMFDYSVKSSFIEREHCKDDTIGLNTIPENLEIGEYFCYSKYENETFDNLSLVIGVTQLIDGYTGTVIYDNIPSGIHYFAFDTTLEGYLTDAEYFIKKYAESSKTGLDAIVCMFLYPTSLINKYTSDMTNSGGIIYGYKNEVINSKQPHSHYFLIDKNDCFGFEFEPNTPGYQYNTTKPKNNKLFTYPYMYLLCSNNNGGSAIYQYEHFNNSTFYFKIYGCITPGGSIRLIPEDYKGVEVNDEEGLNLGKFAVCNWTGDVFTNWLTQNSINIGISTVAGLFQIVGGAVATATGAGAFVGAPMIMSGVASVAGSIGEIHKASMTPPQAQGNINNGDVITATGQNKFTFYNMRIKPEYMKIVDDYFSMFGYKTNRVKVPNKNHRKNWWYTKTIDVNISGNIPVKDKEKISDYYNAGITFWKNPSTFKNYDSDNSII